MSITEKRIWDAIERIDKIREDLIAVAGDLEIAKHKGPEHAVRDAVGTLEEAQFLLYKKLKK